MKILRYTLIILIITLFTSANAGSDGVFQTGEMLIYEVSFWGFGLGKIEIYTNDTAEIQGELTYKTKAKINSYEGIPFLSLHSIFNSWVDPEYGCSRYFTASNKWKDDWDYQKITFNYEEDYVLNEKWYKKKKYLDRKYHTTKKWNDGLSLFFFARKFLRLGKNVRVPTVMDRDTVYTYINFLNEKAITKIKAVDHPVSTIHFTGKAGWTGLYGLSGDFEGWFSDDSAAVPIKASMNVYIGSIDIELIEWERTNWTPPEAIKK